MILVDGKGAVLGRLATFVAKEALKGEEVKIVNVDKVIITGNKKTTEAEFKVKRSRVGHSQKGPKHPATSEKIVKRAIRGMLPNHREGRGREAFKKIFCYSGVPKELEGKDMVVVAKDRKMKYAEVRDFARIK